MGKSKQRHCVLTWDPLTDLLTGIVTGRVRGDAGVAGRLLGVQRVMERVAGVLFDVISQFFRIDLPGTSVIEGGKH